MTEPLMSDTTVYVGRKRRRSKKGKPRVRLDVRVKQTARDAIDARAAAEGLDRSEQTRIALSYAMAEMPPGWRPKDWKP